MKDSADYLRWLFNNMTDPNIINLGGGSPAKEALPREIIEKLSHEILSDPSQGCAALQYSNTQGISELREAVVEELLIPKGVTDQTAKNVLIVNGGLETMYLVCQAYIQPNDVILVENPAFIHCVDIFNMFEAKCVPCDCDDFGLVLEDVETKIKKYNVKMVYTVPTFNNPTGKTLPIERRRKLAELGSQYDVIILEDDPYRDIRYSGEELLPIKAFDKTGNTIMANSFSKIFSPGSRLGYSVATKEIIQTLTDIKIATNSHTSTISQALAAKFFNGGYYPEHIKRICDLYRSRRDVMLTSIDKYFPEGTKHTMPDGGFYTWVELPGALDATRLSPEANKLGIAYLPGEAWHMNGNREGTNTLRMCFSSTPEEKIEYAVKTLGKLFCDNL
jgi:Transcriptional regulators containing a DNA-binding HTH domain and an aminotransferase domain (MocR family) and their eukaryotic orthologs